MDDGVTAGSPGVLDGVRVVDLGNSVACLVAGLILAEAGADVVMVEPPGGNELRARPGFRTWGRSKRSVTVDLDDPVGRGELGRLLGGADVVLHSYGPATSAPLGLDDRTLAERFPQLIVSSILGWPANHADADALVDDELTLARLGVLDEQLGRREGPIYVRFPLGTWHAAWLSVAGVLARLIDRQRTGHAGPAHTSLAQGALVPMMMHWRRADHPSAALATGMPKDNMRASLFECADGRWIHTMPPPPDDTPLMKEVFAELGADAVAEANAAVGDRAMPGWVNWGAIIAAYRRRSADEWLQNLWDHDIPAQEAVAVGQIFGDEQAMINRYVLQLDDPEAGAITVAGLPVTVVPPTAVRGPAPGAGADDGSVEWAPRPAAEPHGEPSRSPLEGVHVVDFGNFLAGPLGPMLLADLGATVVKVEAATGDQMRWVEWAFAGCQRGKRAVALDLKSPAARPAVESLLRWADVVHHNLRLPAARRLGLDADAVHAVSPDTVFCHVSSYGPTGPRADWPGYDQLFQACCGWEVAGAGEGNPPMWHRFGFMDHLCALSSVAATLLALYHRDVSGQATSVAASLLGAGALTNSETYRRADGTLAPIPVLDAAQTMVSPGERIVQLADGWIAVAAVSTDQVEALCAVFGVDDPQAIDGEALSRTAADVRAALDAARVPAATVQREQQGPFFDDPAHRAAGLVATYQHGEWGRLEQPGAMWWFVDQDVQLGLAPPLLGEHTVEVLTEVGVAPSMIDELLDAGVAVQHG